MHVDADNLIANKGSVNGRLLVSPGSISTRGFDRDARRFSLPPRRPCGALSASPCGTLSEV